MAHAVGEYAWSNDSLLLSLYDSSAVAPLTSVTPTFADRHRPVLLELRGSNFVPSGAADARCRFRSRNGDTFANASVVSSRLARCVAPHRGSAPADADAGPPVKGEGFVINPMAEDASDAAASPQGEAAQPVGVSAANHLWVPQPLHATSARRRSDRQWPQGRTR